MKRYMSPTDLHRLYHAARALDTTPARMEALQARYVRAETVLRAALAHGPIALPGYRAALSDGRATVTRAAIIDAAQLALWRTLQEPNHDAL